MPEGADGTRVPPDAVCACTLRRPTSAHALDAAHKKPRFAGFFY
jgi:hypothetical protein